MRVIPKLLLVASFCCAGFVFFSGPGADVPLFTGPRAEAEQTPPPVSGTLDVAGRTFRLTHAVAYKGDPQTQGEGVTIVVASTAPLPLEKVAALDKKDRHPDQHLWQPHVIVTFNGEGKPVEHHGWCHNFTFSTGTAPVGEIKLKDGRCVGTARHVDESKEVKYRHGCDFAFNLPLTDLSTVTAAKPRKVVQVENLGDAFAEAIVGALEKSVTQAVEESGISLEPEPPPRFVAISAADAAIKVDIRTGESWYLQTGPDGADPQWVRIEDEDEAPVAEAETPEP